MRTVRTWAAGIAAALLLTVGVSFASTPQSAYAEDRCTPYVVDDANVIGTRKDEVTTAVKSLEEVGAEGRVITIKTFAGQPNLDAYIAQMAASCPSWQSGGQTKANFFGLFVSTGERKIAVYYSTRWKSQFDTKATDIQANVMRPQFAKGNYAQGMIDAVEAIKTEIKHPTVPSGNGGMPAQPTQTQTAPSVSIDWGIVWIVIGCIVGILALVAFIILVIVPMVRARNETQKLREKAIALMNQCKAGIAELQALVDKPDLITSFEDFAVVGGKVLEQAKDDRSKAQNFLTEAQSGMDRAAKIGDLKLHLSDARYLDISSAYKSALKSIEAGRSHIDAVGTQHDELIVEANDAAGQIEGLDAQCKEANTALLGLSSSGFDISKLSADLDATSQQVMQYRNLHDASALVLIGALPDLKKSVGQSTEAIETYRAQIARCETEPAQLRAQYKATLDKQTAAYDAHLRMSKTYARSSWANVEGNGTEAEKRLARVASLLVDDLEKQKPATVDDVDKRIKLLDLVTRLLDEADDLLDAIIARETNIDDAKNRASEEIGLAQADIEKAEAYIAQNADDLSSDMKRPVAKAREHLDDASRELALVQPNYLVVVKKALLANKEADEILALAMSEHERRESLRQQLASTIRLIETSADKSERYISNHSSDVGDDASKLVKKARRVFATIDGGSSLEDQLRTAQEALELANEAYDSASQDFRAAEAERQAEAEREREAERARARERERERERNERLYAPAPSSYQPWGAPSSPTHFGGGGFSGGGGGFSASSGY